MGQYRRVTQWEDAYIVPVIDVDDQSFYCYVSAIDGAFIFCTPNKSDEESAITSAIMRLRMMGWVDRRIHVKRH